MKFTVYGEPVGKARHRKSGRGHAYTPAKTLQAEKRVLEAWKEAGGGTIDHAVKIRAKLFYGVASSLSKRVRQERLENRVPCCKKPDGDNVEKLLMDSLPFAVSDQMVVDGHWTKYWSDVPRMEIEVVEWLP